MTTNTNEIYKSKIDEKINEIEGYLEYCSDIPLWGTVVKSNEIKKHIAELKKFAYQEMEESRRIKTLEEKILSDAKAEAQTIVDQAKESVKRMDAVKQANDLANQIIHEARSKAETMLTDAKLLQNHLIDSSHKHVDDMFNEAEREFEEYISKIKTNRNELNLYLTQMKNETQKTGA